MSTQSGCQESSEWFWVESKPRKDIRFSVFPGYESRNHSTLKYLQLQLFRRRILSLREPSASLYCCPCASNIPRLIKAALRIIDFLQMTSRLATSQLIHLCLNFSLVVTGLAGNWFNEQRLNANILPGAVREQRVHGQCLFCCRPLAGCSHRSAVPLQAEVQSW